MVPLGGIMEYRVIRIAFLAFALCLSGAGVNAAAQKGQIAKGASFQWTSPTKRILLVTPDVQLGALDAGGIVEPRADWTQSAQGFIDKGVREHFGRSNVEVVSADNPSPRGIQLTKLHGVVGRAILTHLYNTPLKLPNKGNALDWTLGPGTNEMRDQYNADYALFVFVRDSYTTAARRAEQVAGVIAAAFLGVGVIPTGGVQIGFASLVDLRTGNIVWFNRLLNKSGDLRTEAPARTVLDELIGGLPI
jgi:hypothetical protein